MKGGSLGRCWLKKEPPLHLGSMTAFVDLEDGAADWRGTKYSQSIDKQHENYTYWLFTRKPLVLDFPRTPTM
jgi:hypothetical protein